MRTGTVASTDNRNWELLPGNQPQRRFSQSRAVALDMESATIAANGFRFRVPYGTLLCVSDKPLHGEIKLPGMANQFYRERVEQHLRIGMAAIDILRSRGLEPAAQPQAAQLCRGGVPVKLAPRLGSLRVAAPESLPEAAAFSPSPGATPAARRSRFRGVPRTTRNDFMSRGSRKVQASPKSSGISRCALGVSASARPSSSWRTQPRRSDSCSQAAPSAPPRCGRRSLQSRQAQAKRRRVAARVVDVEPRLSSAHRALGREFVGAAVGSALQPALGMQPVVQRDARRAGHVVVAGARRAQAARACVGLELAARRAGHHQQAFERGGDLAAGQAEVAVLALRHAIRPAAAP